MIPRMANGDLKPKIHGEAEVDARQRMIRREGPSLLLLFQATLLLFQAPEVVDGKALGE